MGSMIIVINGMLGSGKTLFMTYLVKRFMLKGLPAYTNYRVDGAQNLDVLMNIRDLSNCVIAIDDSITEGFDSYSQMGKGGKLATKVLRFARKRDLILIFSQQVYTGIAIRVRHITNYVFNVRQVTFPYFRVQGYLPDGRLWINKILRYSPEIYQSYDTKEEVTQRVTIGELNKLYNIARKNRTIFVDLLTGQLALNNDVSKSIYECLNTRNYEALEIMSDYWGLTIEPEGKY